MGLSILLTGYSEPPSQDKTKTLPLELEQFRSTIERSELNYVQIIAHPETNTEPWVSKFLGTPYLPLNSPYPRDIQGAPLQLLVQLNFAEMPNLEGYPTQGILQFFISGAESSEHVWGMNFYEELPFDTDKYFESLQMQKYFRVIYYPTVIQDRKQLALPPRLDPNIVLPINEEARLSFNLKSEYVDVSDYRFAKVFGKTDYDFFDQFGEQAGEIANAYIDFSYEHSLAKVGGYAYFVQEDPRYAKPNEDWLVLLHSDSSSTEDDVDVLWGDGGIGVFLIRRSDLQKLDFSRVAYYWDNH